jgi:Tfp pilus assembly protein PilN
MKNLQERLLAVVVAAVGLMLAGFFVTSWVQGQFATRRQRISQLEKEIRDFKRQVLAGQLAAKKLAEYEARSLPSNPEIARTRYQQWLVNVMESAGLIEPDISFQRAQVEKNLFVKQSFTVEAAGTLPQIVEMLYAFYSVDWLHQIIDLKLRPVKDSKLLNLTMQVEALSLMKAKNTDKLDIRPSQRLALQNREAYYDQIVGRNPFGPRNNPPALAVRGLPEVFLGREVELTIQATDPDPLDRVYLQLTHSAAPDAELDPATGKFRWRPKAVGTYEFVVEGIDDGFPTQISPPQKIVVQVKEQPPPRPTEPPAFDFAKFTQLTALIEVDGRSEVWLHVRPLGQIVVLREGDQFSIGSVKGTVSEIGEYDFCFDFEGKRRRLSKGELLDQAKVIGEIPQIASPAQPSMPVEAEVPRQPPDKAG